MKQIPDLCRLQKNKTRPQAERKTKPLAAEAAFLGRGMKLR